MQVSILQENLHSALSNVSRFVSSKTQLPILSNILLATDEGRLKLSATNLELGINCWVGAKIETPGSITIPAREITEFVSYLSAGRLDLIVNDQSLLQVKNDKVDSTFATSPAADFPQSPLLDPNSSFQFNLDLLTQAVAQTTFAAAADDSRPVLTAVLWKITATDFDLIATDGFRLSIKHVKLVNPLELKDDQTSLTFLVPARSLVEVTKLAKTNQNITLGPTSDGHQFLFALGDYELSTRLIEGDYPPYERIIPSGHTTSVTLDKDEFAQAVKIASVFARESANVVKLKVAAHEIELSANAPQVGRNRTTVEAKVDGEGLEIAFNYKFINDFLSVVKGKEITIELNQSLTPGSFHDNSDPNFTHIIMPVRIQD